MAEIPMAFNLALPKPGAGASAVASMYAADRAQESSLVRSAASYKLGMEQIKEDYFSAMLLSRDKALERQRQDRQTWLNERQREMEREKGIHEFTLKQFNEGLKTALNLNNDANVEHYKNLIDYTVQSMSPYFQRAFAPWLSQNATGSVEYKDYNFRKNNPYPEMPEGLKFEDDPYTYGNTLFKQDEWHRRRANANTGKAIEPEPSFIKLPPKVGEDPVYIMKDSGGRPYFMSSQDMNINDMIKRHGGKDADVNSFYKNGGVIRGNTYNSVNPASGRVEQHQLETRPFEEEGKKFNVKVLPPAGQTSFDERPSVNPFAGYNSDTQDLINGVQVKFGPYMQLTADELNEVVDPTPSATMLKEIRRMLDNGLEFEEIAKRLSGKIAPDLNVRLIEPKQFDKYTWYNPADFLDPEHIRGRAAAKDPNRFAIDPKTGKASRPTYAGYEYDVGSMGMDIARFWEGSVYSQGPDFDIRFFRGVLTPFQKHDGSIVKYYYNNQDGADIVTSANGIKLGTKEYVTNYLLRGGAF
ncbi:MAG: hypothetical protein ACYSWP_07575 [Planctomycetota bacterium]|jgi:hypothetical protein